MPLVGQRRLALPRTYSAVPSALGLNFRVRNGTGCTSPAMVADQRGAFCCQGPAWLGPQGRTARNGMERDRARRRVTHRHLGSRVKEELGLLVPLG